ncbi:MAG: hypothetical protein E7034_08435 [Akkermansiaceae bacterium]|nr:hypothetical protein [Akkermansiaceae bacterium]
MYLKLKQNIFIIDLMMTPRQSELLQAIQKNKTQKVFELLSKGVNPNFRFDITPVHAAVNRGNLEVLKALLKAGANPNLRSSTGSTALEYAMTGKHPIDRVYLLVSLLLQYGAKADEKGSFLHHSELVRQLKCPKLEKLFPDLPEKAEKPALGRGSLRAQAAWAGFMVGDALGTPVAARSQREVQRLYPLGLRKMESGVVGDASKRAFSLHASLHEAEGWSRNAVLYAYRKLSSGMRNGERAALNGAPDAATQDNGSLARVLPIALWAAEHPDFDWQSAVREDAAVTHPNPECAEVNAVYVHAVLQAMKPGATPQGIYEASLDFAAEQGVSAPVQETLLRAATERPAYDGVNRSSVQVALQSVFFQLLHAADFRSALEDIVNAGGETDTNAAVAGALLALAHGVESIPHPWLVAVRAVNERRYVRLLPRRA